MNGDRRLRRFHVTPEALGMLLRGTGRVVGRPLPEDAEVVSMDWSADYHALDVKVHSAAFGDLPAVMPVPIENAPIIEESGSIRED